MELIRFQKIILAALAAMLVLFGGLMAFFRARPGVEFEEGFLKIMEQEDRIVYSGRAHGTPVDVSVSRPADGRFAVEFEIGSEIHDVCEIQWPVDRLRTEFGDTVGLARVTKNGEVIFEGGYDPDGSYGMQWYGENGEIAPFTGIDVRFYTSGSDPWAGYETSLIQIARFAFGPETSARGHPALFAMAAFLSIVLALDVVFHKELFRWRHWAARDPEPTAEYLAIERVGWVIFAAVIAALYLGAMVEVY